MKIVAIEESFNNSVCVCYPDSSLLRNNDDFYIPNFSSHIQATIGVYISIHKIGKHIDTQFIHRYYKSYGLAINFVATDVIQQLHNKHLSTDMARGFDHSFAVSTHVVSKDSHPFEKAHFECTYNTMHFESKGAQIIDKIHAICAECSQYYTLKIGDIVFLPLWNIPGKINIGDLFNASINTQYVLHCSVK